MDEALHPERRTRVRARRDLPRRVAYECPVCGARVHLRKGILRRPHFAHSEPSPECEEYHRAFADLGDYVDRDTIQLGLFVEPELRLYARIPAPGAPAPGVTLRSLASARMSIVATGTSLGAAAIPDLVGHDHVRIPVSPAVGRHAVHLQESVAEAFPALAATLECRGLAIAGVLFRQVHSEWLRPAAGGVVYWGESVFVVAAPQQPPPEPCHPQHVATWSGQDRDWHVWFAVLPQADIDAVAEWLRGLGIVARSASPSARILGCPTRVGSAERPEIESGAPLVLEFRPARQQGVRLKITSRTGAEEFVTTSPAFVLLEASLPTGDASLSFLPHGEVCECLVVDSPSVDQVADILASAPRLQVCVEGSPLELWTEDTPAQKRKAYVAVSAPPCVASTAVTFIWCDEATRVDKHVEASLSDASVTLARILSEQDPPSLVIDAGALGRATLNRQPPPGKERAHGSRESARHRWVADALRLGVLTPAAVTGLTRAFAGRGGSDAPRSG